MKHFSLFIVLTGVFFLYTCSDKIPMSDEEMISELIKKNAQSLEIEDADMLEETMDTASPVFKNSIELAEQLFETYDLAYNIDSFSIDRISGAEAEVSFIQTTTKKAGPAFRNNRLSGKHLLHKVSGEWKIYNSQVDNIEYLN